MHALPRVAGLLGALGALLFWTATASAWVDANQNGIDDPIETVNTNGLTAAYENGDLNQRMLIAVFPGAELQYGIYVGYDHHPTAVDEAALAAVLSPGTQLKTYLYIDYTRTQASWSQIQTIMTLPGVTRVESIPMMYPTNHVGTRVVRARDSRGLKASENEVLFPSAQAQLGLDGTGITVAILDSGVNDAPSSVNPQFTGHESLLGKFLGGGEFFLGQPLLNTGLTESMNPEDNGPDTWHGTHVAGTAIGNGGQTGFFAGVAPEARLVDCKVLSDAGAGFGSTDGVEWCIFNKDNDWGLTGPDAIYAGIDVLNLSLGCLDCDSDGTSAGEQMINAAVDAGLVVCIATGNDDKQSSIGSPAAADKCIAVGASTHNATLDRSDDLVTSFSNEGPRTSDGDLDQLDEYKPNVVAPGAGIISAKGDPYSTTGEAYHGLSGTSMASPHVAGVAALLLQFDPSATPLEIREALQNSAIHHISSEKGDRPADPSNLDQNYNPMSGWGLIDTYAAVKELANNTSGVQVVRIRAVPRPDDLEIDVHWWSQREYAFQGYNVHRAPDVGGAPGAFAQVNGALIPGVGDPVIVDDPNRTPYTYVDNDPALVLGQTYWYQIEWVDTGGGSNLEPPVPVEFGNQPLVATAYYSIRHNTPDNDLFVRLGTSSSYNPDSAEYFTLGEGSGSADEVVTHEPANAGTAVNGYLQYYWSRGFTVADGIQGFLPPSSGSPWFLNVREGGYVNRVGTMEAFSMFVNDSPGSASGTTYVTDSLTPTPTIDEFFVPGATTTMWIPEESPVSTAVLHLEALGEEGRIRLEMDFANQADGTRARVSRSRTRNFQSRVGITSDLEVRGRRFSYVDEEVQPGIEYWYWVETVFPGGTTLMNGPVQAKATAGSVTFARGPQPNPVPGRGTFSYAIGTDQADGGAVPIRLTLHDVRGRKVRTLETGARTVGRYQVDWDGRDDSGQSVARGVYYFRFQAGSHTSSSKVTVVR